MTTARSQLRCSGVARQIGTDPTGSAGSYTKVLIIECPLPWPADALDVPALAPLAAALADAKPEVPARVQLAVPTEADAAEVTLYERPDGAFRTYFAASSSGDHASVADRAVELLSRASSATYLPTVSDVLVCTHGKRDLCCGSLGTSLFAELSAMWADVDDVRVRRTSHLGGHRFAPTVLIMPSGTLWAWVTAEMVRGIIDRTVDLETAAPHYRGTMGLEGPEAQAVDAAMLRCVGWSWLDRERSGAVVARSGADASVRLVHSAGGHEGTVRATVRRVEEVAVPVCGEELDRSTKTAPRWSVTDLSDT